MTDPTPPKPKRILHKVVVDVWPYGDGVWIQATCVGENVEIFNTLIGGPTAYNTLAQAMFRIGAELGRYSIPCVALADLDVIKHEEAKPAPKRAIEVCDTAGEIHDDGIEISFGGACPVQGNGTIDGYVAYYRSRGTGWSLALYPAGTDLDEYPWPKEEVGYYAEEAYAFPDGGWLHADESEANIRKAAGILRAGLR